MPNALANVVFQSSDTSLQGWTQTNDSNTILTLDTIRAHVFSEGTNQYSLEINSPQGAGNYAWIQSYVMSPFSGSAEYIVMLKIFPTTQAFFGFYIYYSQQICLFLNTENNQPHLIAYGYNQNAQEVWLQRGILNTMAWNTIVIWVPSINGYPWMYDVSLNGGALTGCYFDNWFSNGDQIIMGDNDFGGGANNYGHAYFDSIRISHSENPDPTINNYDLSEDFAFGLNYVTGDWNAREFWHGNKNGAGAVQTVTTYNNDVWDTPNGHQYVNAQPYKQAWEKTPTFTINNNGGFYNEYSISFWFYLDSKEFYSYYLVFNGHVKLYLTTDANNVVCLYYHSSEGSGKISELSPQHWYKMYIDIFPGYTNPCYEVYLDNQLFIDQVHLHNYLSHGYSDIKVDNQNGNNYITGLLQ
jgi:hypothetical protein